MMRATMVGNPGDQDDHERLKSKDWLLSSPSGHSSMFQAIWWRPSIWPVVAILLLAMQGSEFGLSTLPGFVT